MTGVTSHDVYCDRIYIFVIRSNRDYSGGDRGRPQTRVHPSMSLSAAEQESHTVGNSASWPTAVEYFQHRSHLTPSARSMTTFRSSPGSSTTCETMKSDGRSSSNP